jgi:hypothetical protein
VSAIADWLCWIVGGGLTVASMIATARARPSARATAILAQRLGLTLDGQTLRGTWNGTPVTINLRGFRWTVRAPAPPGVRIVGVSQARAALTADRVHTGDLSLDNVTLVTGPRDRLVAVLDGGTRVHLRELVLGLGFQGTVADGSVSRHLVNQELDVGTLSIILNTVTEVSRALHAEPTAERLSGIARTDLWAGVRRNAIESLGRLHPDAAVAVARDLLRDADQDVRIEAARLAGPDGLAHLVGSPGDLDAALAADAEGTARRLLALPEDALVALLARANRPGRRAAAQALGQLGTVGAVEPLLTAGFVDEARAIQARLGDVEAGRLSLAAGEAGQVALATDVGAVTVTGPSD